MLTLALGIPVRFVPCNAALRVAIVWSLLLHPRHLATPRDHAPSRCVAATAIVPFPGIDAGARYPVRFVPCNAALRVAIVWSFFVASPSSCNAP